MPQFITLFRYNVRMAAGVQERGRIPIQKWRKHMHWTSLLRTHAELIANDTEVIPLPPSTRISNEMQARLYAVNIQHHLPIQDQRYSQSMAISCIGLIGKYCLQRHRYRNCSQEIEEISRNLRNIFFWQKQLPFALQICASPFCAKCLPNRSCYPSLGAS